MAEARSQTSGGRPISAVPYLPGLDGVRALAVIAVIAYHAGVSWMPGGFLGVEVFFAISGYLITLLLLAEHERTGRISIRQFYGRRARRLLPALIALLIAVATLYSMLPFLRQSLARQRGALFWGLFYGSNSYECDAQESTMRFSFMRTNDAKVMHLEELPDRPVELRPPNNRPLNTQGRASKRKRRPNGRRTRLTSPRRSSPSPRYPRPTRST